jgi:hypothetical protein
MHPDVLLTIILAGAAAAAYPLYGWFQAYRRNLELEARQHADQPDARIEELQRAVDALTDQCAQLAESQDFISRVLSERLPALPGRSSRLPEVSTPH